MLPVHSHTLTMLNYYLICLYKLGHLSNCVSNTKPIDEKEIELIKTCINHKKTNVLIKSHISLFCISVYIKTSSILHSVDVNRSIVHVQIAAHNIQSLKIF